MALVLKNEPMSSASSQLLPQASITNAIWLARTEEFLLPCHLCIMTITRKSRMSVSQAPEPTSTMLEWVKRRQITDLDRPLELQIWMETKRLPLSTSMTPNLSLPSSLPLNMPLVARSAKCLTINSPKRHQPPGDILSTPQLSTISTGSQWESSLRISNP